MKEAQKQNWRLFYEKDFFSVVGLSLVLGSGVSVYAAYGGSGYYGGYDGTSIAKKWESGWNLNGNWVMSTATNRSEKPAYMKHVFAQCGEAGSWSQWVSSGTSKASVQDFGPNITDQYDSDFQWDVD